jgi:8-oxo-dGTP pyrophosphatase MutT (NUDIX family)
VPTGILELMGDDVRALGGEAAAAAPARPAATLMLVRDGDHPTAPLEVLMVRRSLRSDFVGGAHVFPGGAVDPADGGPRAEDLCGGMTDAEASATLELAAGGLAYWVAAIRECFEEAGILLARGAGGTPLSFADPDDAARFAGHRRDVNAGRRTFLDVCSAECLTLAVGSMSYFSHWITPEGGRRRYDTRFFVAPAPPGQTSQHDSAETISDVWIRPEDALVQHRRGAIELVFPTIRSLQAIGRYPSAAELLAASRRPARVPAHLPRMVADGHGWRILLAGDPGYDEPVALGGVDVEEAVRAISRTVNQGPDAADAGAGAGPAGGAAPGSGAEKPAGGR